MSSLLCPACSKLADDGDLVCRACGVALPGRDQRRIPVWVWIAGAAGCGCLGLVAIGVVAAFLMPRIAESIDGAKRAGASADLTEIRAALNEYATRNAGEYPMTLDALVTPDANGYRYLQQERVPRDPWKNPYEYHPAEPGEFEPALFSSGPDGIPGTDDDVYEDTEFEFDDMDEVDEPPTDEPVEPHEPR